MILIAVTFSVLFSVEEAMSYITILEGDSMTARDVDRKIEARVSLSKNMAVYGAYALSHGLPCNGRKDFDLLEEILRHTIGKDFQTIGNLLSRS